MTDLTGTAVFRPVDYTIAPRTVGAGSIVLTPANRYYRFGATVTVEASPAPGWRFDHWEDAAFGCLTVAATILVYEQEEDLQL